MYIFCIIYLNSKKGKNMKAINYEKYANMSTKQLVNALISAEKKEQKLKQEAEKKFKESAELIRFLTSKIKENLEKPKYEFFTREQTNLDELVKEVESKMTPEEIKEIKLQLEKEMNTVYDDEL